VAKRKAKPAEPTPPLPQPLILDTTSRFDKDAKRQEKRRKSLDKLFAIIEALRNRRPLDPNHKDHPLGGDWKGWRDCHIEPDRVLIYQKDEVRLTLGRTGSHSDLFD
jgi:mRNA interferase YafQ